MAWEEELIVAHSNIYDGCGVMKPLLTLIARLMIGADEDETGKVKDDPNVGWCVATEDYLAMRLGCSKNSISKFVKEFKDSGVLEIKNFRDSKGHPRNHYRVIHLDIIKTKHTCEKDEHGHYERKKNFSKVRKNSNSLKARKGQDLNASSNKDLAIPDSYEQSSLNATSNQALLLESQSLIASSNNQRFSEVALEAIIDASSSTSLNSNSQGDPETPKIKDQVKTDATPLQAEKTLSSVRNVSQHKSSAPRPDVALAHREARAARKAAREKELDEAFDELNVVPKNKIPVSINLEQL